MKFKTDCVKKCVARLGVISEIERLPDLTFETPLLLMYSRRGAVPHLTKDVFKMLTNEDQMLSASLPSTIMMTEFVKDFGSLAEYASMKEYPFFLTIQDPSEETNPGYQKKESIAVWSRNGRFTVFPDKYMDMMEVFKPDIYMTLSDADTDINSTSKRVSKSVERTNKLFDKCLKRHLNSDILKNKGILGAVTGGFNLEEREKSIKHMENKPLNGYILDGIHRNGFHIHKIKTMQVKNVIDHSVNLLPNDKLRVLMGCWNPSTLLDLIETGIDVFDSSYPFLMAENSNALVFLCDNEEHNENIINLSEKRFADDFQPICKSCKCLTCQNHMRAYINHLIVTKELLSHVLLMIHNMHQYIEFFKLIRHHIKNQSFKDFKHKIQKKFDDNNNENI